MLNSIPRHEMDSLQPLAQHGKLPKHRQDELYAKLDELCPERLIKGKWPSEPPDNCLPIVVEISNHFLRLIISIAKKYHKKTPSMEMGDLVNEGYFGLFRGVFLFDNRKGYKVSTYVTNWIHQAISRAISDQGKSIRIPPHTGYDISKIKSISTEHYKTNGKWPTIEHISDAAAISQEKVISRLTTDYIINVESLDKEMMTDNESSTLYDYCKNDGCIDSDKYVEENELKTLFDSILPRLTAREERVLRMRFGMPPYKGEMTLKEIGDRFGITRERARQIVKEVLGKLREIDCIAEYLY